MTVHSPYLWADCTHWRTGWATSRESGRLRGNYPETAFEKVIETNGGGTRAINAEIGEVKSCSNHMYGNPTNQELTVY